eukprot:NODE_11354_length_192_cov_0.713287_g10194_i0.p5 GENE.NODE_11354_length_192_cov_0.713287_g10194_i0~~NODE_11354_length_192_cov_0.713287_g10194_i0.p5  ORF type:complete len:63 (-),score=23.87 NODE_11354_length_192_cov_0.713287_g10194_i0:2-190(-)
MGLPASCRLPPAGGRQAHPRPKKSPKQPKGPAGARPSGSSPAGPFLPKVLFGRGRQSGRPTC